MSLVLSSWNVLINSNGDPNISVIKFAVTCVPLLWRDFVGRQMPTLILLFVHCLHLSESCGEWYLFRFMSLLAAVPVCVFRWIPKWKVLGVRGRRVFITPPQLILLKVGLGLSSSLVFFLLIPLLLNLLVLSFIFLPTVTYYWVLILMFLALLFAVFTAAKRGWWMWKSFFVAGLSIAERQSRRYQTLLAGLIL